MSPGALIVLARTLAFKRGSYEVEEYLMERVDYMERPEPHAFRSGSGVSITSNCEELTELQRIWDIPAEVEWLMDG